MRLQIPQRVLDPIHTGRVVPSFLFACLPILACVALLCLAGCGKEEPPEEPETAKKVKLVTLASLGGEGGRSFPGTAEAFQSVDLAFRVAGPLKELPATDGNRDALRTPSRALTLARRERMGITW